MKLSIVMPSYCEEENLKQILPEMKDILQQNDLEYEICVIDTMQPMDKTEEVCQSLDVKYFNREGGNFYGDAIRTGIKVAQGEKILIMDADGSHQPKYIPLLVQTGAQENAGIVIGSRYCKGGKTNNGFFLRLFSKIVNFVYSISFKLKVKDVSNSFRLYDVKLLKEQSFECNNFDIVEEILIKVKLYFPNVVIKEIPITFLKRDKGNSKRKFVKFVIAYMKTLFKLKKFSRQYKRSLRKKKVSAEE